jgi:hypothetical protein
MLKRHVTFFDLAEGIQTLRADGSCTTPIASRCGGFDAQESGRVAMASIESDRAIGSEPEIQTPR